MSLDDYKLSCELFGHSLDVRALAVGQNFIISGSRDKTAKVWMTEGDKFVESVTLNDHNNFISSLCILENNGVDWICTGSNDCSICVYELYNNRPLTTLRGHTSTVSALASGLGNYTLISGSWDQTSRIWKLDEIFSSIPSIILKGHEAAVWAVTKLDELEQYVTGSADKKINFWNSSGQLLHTLLAHNDCVRGLIGFPDGTLLSCSNDASIKYWSKDRKCIKELHGHSNYIYTIALNNAYDSETFVTGSEDSTIRLWNLTDGPLGNSILLPAQSIWSVKCLKNGDIVTGTSDGVVRIFTRDPLRFANDAVTSAYNEACKIRKLDNIKQLGGVNVNDLPGPESLLKQGKASGDTQIVRHPNGKVLCYEWSNNQWNCLGDVIGASGGSQSTSGKVLYDGKEFDYVFDVDIDESQPPIKLPYNRGQDPWVVAQQFINKNELPQVYLDQIANFIIKNSNNAPVNNNDRSMTYQDPFTGSSRYVPGSGIGNNTNNTLSDVNMDPFTGSSSYSTTDNKISKITDTIKHFPSTNYISIDNCDPAKILIKLKEFNNKLEDNSFKSNDSILENVINMLRNDSVSNNGIESLKLLLQWPKELLFPVLDVTRLIVRDRDNCMQLLSSELIQRIIISNLESSSAANQLMAIRCLSNMLQNEYGRGVFGIYFIDIYNSISKINNGSVNLQLAIATLFLNTTISKIEMETTFKIIAESCIKYLKWADDLESIYRTYKALGNLICSPFKTEITDLLFKFDDILQKLNSHINTTQPSEKLNEISKQLIEAL